jgi:hypothetical protein
MITSIFAYFMSLDWRLQKQTATLFEKRNIGWNSFYGGKLVYFLRAEIF